MKRKENNKSVPFQIYINVDIKECAIKYPRKNYRNKKERASRLAKQK